MWYIALRCLASNSCFPSSLLGFITSAKMQDDLDMLTSVYMPSFVYRMPSVPVIRALRQFLLCACNPVLPRSFGSRILLTHGQDHQGGQKCPRLDAQ